MHVSAPRIVNAFAYSILTLNLAPLHCYCTPREGTRKNVPNMVTGVHRQYWPRSQANSHSNEVGLGRRLRHYGWLSKPAP